MKLTIAAGLFAAASGVAYAQAPATSPKTQTPTTQTRPAAGATQKNPAEKGEQTITGCLTSADNVFTLTVLDDSGAPGTTAETIAYTLAPGTGVDLQPLLNKRVTVKGTDAGPDAQSSNRVVMKSPAAPAATGTSGSGARDAKPAGLTPKVETSAKARITSKTFNVTNVQPASGNCGA